MSLQARLPNGVAVDLRDVDETELQVLKEPGRGAQAKSYLGANDRWLRQGRNGATDPAVHLLAQPLGEDGDSAVRRNPARGDSDVSMTTATPATKMKPMRAGGRATEAGMAFQAAVATWFAVHIFVRLPHIQSKTSATLTKREKAPLAKTGMQLATWMAEAKAASGVPDLTRHRSAASRTT
ncbi:hypothetical protein ASC92_17790 [Variovorax sp. Root411]|nr:hypothetical protein ASC92_17790 [Variovorax sp. Root411]